MARAVKPRVSNQKTLGALMILASSRWRNALAFAVALTAGCSSKQPVDTSLGETDPAGNQPEMLPPDMAPQSPPDTSPGGSMQPPGVCTAAGLASGSALFSLDTGVGAF